MDRHQQVIAAIVLIIIGGLFGFLLGRGAADGAFSKEWSVWLPKPPAGETLSPSTSVGSILVGGNAIAVSDQAPGVKVAVSFVTLSQDGWIVVHEEREGQPGNILGARRFSAGANQSGGVELLRRTEDGKVYFAMLHADDGDRKFDHTKDLPITDPQGNVVLMRFVATSQPAQQ